MHLSPTTLDVAIGLLDVAFTRLRVSEKPWRRWLAGEQSPCFPGGPWWRRRESKPVEVGHELSRSRVNRPDSGEPAAPLRDETARPKPEPVADLDAVETALADALAKATASERWDVVGQLARELEARRLARADNVITLASARRRDGGDR